MTVVTVVTGRGGQKSSKIAWNTLWTAPNIHYRHTSTNYNDYFFTGIEYSGHTHYRNSSSEWTNDNGYFSAGIEYFGEIRCRHNSNEYRGIEYSANIHYCQNSTDFNDYFSTCIEYSADILSTENDCAHDPYKSSTEYVHVWYVNNEMLWVS